VACLPVGCSSMSDVGRYFMRSRLLVLGGFDGGGRGLSTGDGFVLHSTMQRVAGDDNNNNNNNNRFVI